MKVTLPSAADAPLFINNLRDIVQNATNLDLYLAVWPYCGSKINARSHIAAHIVAGSARATVAVSFASPAASTQSCPSGHQRDRDTQTSEITRGGVYCPASRETSWRTFPHIVPACVYVLVCTAGCRRVPPLFSPSSLSPSVFNLVAGCLARTIWIETLCAGMSFIGRSATCATGPV